ncbi:FGGY family carbohydrate kinase [uncultured Alistipes sp.]|jgi:putative xylulokinase|uniref:xylulokinase n=1 Tax=uncultured Alistipes sp. TaxID=538949 RepID=UPI0025DBF90F|nr:FGGY family carbohydrate kinase [uncultured Alistipes sp.]
MKSLGIDVGSSSVKVSLLDIETGICVASSANPPAEMPIYAAQSGWAEQDPQMWWQYVCEGIRSIAAEHPMSEVRAVGITYQMHGLVCLDCEGQPLRRSIIWCDSRAVGIGAEAFEKLGRDYCLEHTLNSPGNFTAAKLAWVRRAEPELFGRICKFMLPGDYIAYRLSGEMSTTQSGLSEGILWDFRREGLAAEVCEVLGIPRAMIPAVGRSLETLGVTNAETERLLGIPAGTPLSYRAGDQPNNAFSLNVLDPGEIAATGGTSGVVYGVTASPEAEPQSRVNTFLHVNHKASDPHYGVLLCINGTGILNSWVRRNVTPQLDYPAMNSLAEEAPAGSNGMLVFPFGNGAERMLTNRYPGAAFSDIDLNRHSAAHILRAAQEGIACSFRYGIDIMRHMGLKPGVIRAGRANMFLSPLFVRTLATLCDVSIELYNTDGALGAARGAALGAGLYRTREETFASLRCLETISPDAALRQVLDDTYGRWVRHLEQKLDDTEIL